MNSSGKVYLLLKATANVLLDKEVSKPYILYAYIHTDS